MTTTTAARRPTPPTLGKLEQRIAAQERRVNTGVRTGTISDSEAKSLRARLSKAQTAIQNDAFDGDGLSRGKDAAKRLGGIGKDIHKTASDDQLDGGKMVAELDRRIQAGTNDGSLTQTEATALQQKSSALRTKLAQATTPAEQQALAPELHALAKEIHTERRDGELDAQKRADSFKARIDAGVKDGSLTQDEATKLFSRAAAMASNGAVDATKVNKLSDAIYRHRHNTKMDTKTRSQSLSDRVDALSTQGKLTPDQASAFKAQLNDLARKDSQAVNSRLNVLAAQIAGAAA